MKEKTLNIHGQLELFSKPKLMGILNATPDSFYNQDGENSLNKLLTKAEKMVQNDVWILDIGGMSTKPGAQEIDTEVEWLRIANLIKNLRKKFPNTLLSVDTYRAEIAHRAAMEGIDMINDISAGALDKEMFKKVAQLNLPYIMMHIQGNPRTMQINPQYKNITHDILSYFIEQIQLAEFAGIKDIIIDPGFGFGKTIAQNYELLKNLHQLSILEKPMLVGLSRKSMIYKKLNGTAEEALNGTTALNMVALLQGAQILRVHDVKVAKECITLWEALQD